MMVVSIDHGFNLFSVSFSKIASKARFNPVQKLIASKTFPNLVQKLLSLESLQKGCVLARHD